MTFHSNFVELLRRRASEQAEQPAYIFLADGEAEGNRLTYFELDLRARAIGTLLQQIGAGGERVLLLYPPGLDYIAAFFGCLYAGAVAVPTYPPRPNRSLFRLQAIVTDAQATVALTTSAIRSKITQSKLTDAPELSTLRWLDTENLADYPEDEWQQPEIKPEALAFLQYTSGSTAATPKGVMVSHGNLIHNEQTIKQACQHSEESTFVGWLPLYHDMGLIGNVLQPLFIGAPGILMSPVAFLQRPVRWLQAISRYRAVTSGGPNFAYDLCARRITPDQCAELDLSSWTTAFNGAEPVRAKTMERFAAAFRPYGFRHESFYPCYGLAEATLFVAGGRNETAPVTLKARRAELQHHEVVPAGREDENVQTLVSCGQALLGQQVVIVEPKSLSLCPEGQVGEIWLSGPSVALGYWGRPEETAQTFGAHLAEGDQGPFLRTGDLGFLHDSELFVTGRLKDLIIIRGRNHYPQDIELTVERSHCELRPGCGAVFSVDIDSEERLVCVHEAQSRRPVNTQAIIESIRQAIAEEHELQVYAIALIKPGTIPKTSSGKIQRHACRQEFSSGRLSLLAEWHAQAATEREASAHASPHLCQSLEEVEAWLQLQLAAKLGIETNEVDLEQPLARYGIDSLAAVELAHKIEVDLGVALSMSTLLQSVSLSSIAIQVFGALATYSSNSITPVEDKGSVHPLSYGQRSLFFLHQLEPQSSAYNIARAIRIRSSIDVAALRRSLQALLDRHPALRTTFTMQQGEPVQQVHERLVLAFEQEDASSWNSTQIKERMTLEANSPFDLESGPLLRFRLFTRSSEDHFLLLAVHHIVADFWSTAVLVDELGMLIEAERAETTVALPPPTLSYTDYAQWQAGVLAGSEGERLWEYWCKQLTGDLPVLNFPATRSSSPALKAQGAARIIKLSSTLTDALKTLTQAHDATLYMTLLAAFYVFLHRYTGQEDILVGSPTNGRSMAAFSRLVGYFVNPVALRANLSGDPTFESFLGQVRRTVLDAFAHQDYPFGLLVERLQPDREAGYGPLLQAVFVMQQAPLASAESLASFALGEAGARINVGGLTLESVALDQPAAPFDLTLTMAETNGELTASLQYRTDLFHADMAQQMLDQFEVLLEGIVADPGKRLSELPLINETDKKRLLAKWRNVETSYAQDRCLHELFEAQVERTPDAIAVVFEDERVTYRELNGRANQLAHYLLQKGVGPETLTGVLLSRSIELVVGILGVLKAGGAYVPLDTFYPQDRIGFVLADAGIQVLLTEQRMRGQAPAQGVHVVWLEADAEAISLESRENPTHRTTAENLAYVIYTSGSTGQPKGTLVNHANVTRLFGATECWFRFNKADVWTLFHSVAFDFSVWELWGALLYGGRLVIVPFAVSRSPEIFIELLRREAVTVLNQTPSAFRQLMRVDERSSGILSLRLVIFGGEALDIGNLRPWFERHSDARPQLINMYGITETTVHVTYRPLTIHDAEQNGSVIGGPIPDLRLYVLDSSMQPLPAGVAGQMYVGGAGVARGYLNRPELTAQRFVPDPFSSEPGARMYSTGDRARVLPGGDIEYLGRVDEQVKIRGFRVELGEIEATLRQHPALREAVVVARKDSSGETQLTAYLVAASAVTPSVNELRAYLKAKLPEYMVPSAFVALDQLPLTPHGKLHRQALPLPPQARPELDARFIPPQTKEEKALAEVWGAVLGLEQVGLHDNFFDLGGDSIRSLQVKVRVQERGWAFGLEELFKYPTIYALAKELQPVDVAVSPEATTAFNLISEDDKQRLPPDIEDAYPLTRLQTGLVFLSEHSSDYESYVTSLHLRARLDVDALQAAAAQLAQIHPMLRTSFDLSHFSEPLQFVHSRITVPFNVLDWRQLSQSEQQKLLAESIETMRRKRFNWTQPPLFSLDVYRRSEETFQLTLSEPFLDGWSVASLLTDLFKIYHALLEDNGCGAVQSPKALFKEYVALEKNALASSACRQYWMEKVRDGAVTPLPQATPSTPTGEALPIERLNVPVPPAVSAALHQLARFNGMPLKSVLLSAHLKVMSFLHGQDDVVTGLLYNGRPEVAEGERVLGLFLNVLPFRMELSACTWTELVSKAFEAERESLPFRRYPLAELQRRCGGQPLFETAFNFTHFHVYQTLQGLNGVEVLDGYASDQTFFDLTAQFNVDHDKGHVRLALDYRTTKFSAEQIKAIGAYYNNALAAMTDNPQAHHTTQSLLSPQERLQFLEELNDTASDELHDLCLPELFEAQVERTPDAPALVLADDVLTYRELNGRANQLAHYLRGQGVAPGVLVGICMQRSLEMLVGLLGILKAGGAYLPLDPEYPKDRLAYMLDDARVDVLVTQARLVPSLPKRTTEIKLVCLDSDWHEITHESANNPLPLSLPESRAYVIYTSGSTGQPKAVQVPHRAVVNFLNSMRLQPGLTERDALLAVTTLSFDIAALELFLPLAVGARVVVADREATFDGARLLELLLSTGATVMQATPASWRLLLEAGWQGHSQFKILCGGEALSPELAAGLLPKGAALWNLYGPTETTIWSAASQIKTTDSAISIGRPIANTQLYLLDRHLQPVPVSVPGQLYIGGSGLADGYLNRPELTAEKFIPNPFAKEPGSRLYSTGDMARYGLDGQIEILGRADHQVKVRGYRIELGEIEAALRAHSAVREAVVLVTQEEAHRRLVAYIVSHTGNPPTPSVLRAYLQEKLPGYMVPSAFVMLKAMPLTPNGKIDRRRLPQASQAQHDPDQISELLRQLEHLSDQQTQQLLAQKKSMSGTRR